MKSYPFINTNHINCCLKHDIRHIYLIYTAMARSLVVMLRNTDLPTPPIALFLHGDFIKWKHFPRYWPFVRGIHRSPVNSPHKGQWRGALMFSLIFALTKNWANNGDAGDLRRHRAHYDVIVIFLAIQRFITNITILGTNQTRCAVTDGHIRNWGMGHVALATLVSSTILMFG